MRTPEEIVGKDNYVQLIFEGYVVKPGWECAARKQGTAGGNDPADCDWPFCGCDPDASKVIEALHESGAMKE